MRRFATILAVAAVTVSVYAAGPEPVRFDLTTVPTNATAQASGSSTNDMPVYGWVDTVILDFGGYASPTVDVDIITVADCMGPSRTLFSIDNITADGAYPVRDIATTTAGVDIPNTPALIPLCGDRIAIRCYAANVTNAITVSAWVLYRPTP